MNPCAVFLEFRGEFGSALARLIEACSAGRLKIKVYGATELVPAFEVFDAVSSGTAELRNLESDHSPRPSQDSLNARPAR